MPKNKFQEVIFTIIMVFFMVYAMICYNIVLNTGAMTNSVFLSAFRELTFMGPIAFVLDFFLVSKMWKDEMGYQQTKDALEKSLKRLGTDYLDIYLIHWPRPSADCENWKELDLETWRAMEELQKEGKIRGLGLSNFLPHHIKNILENGTVKPVVNQLELHPGYMQQAAVQYCKEHGIQMQAWSPIGRRRILEDGLILELAGKYQVSPAQLCLRFLLQNDIIPLPKSSSMERMKQNMDLFHFEISEEDVSRLATMPQAGWSGEHPDPELAQKFSYAPDYVQAAKAAIGEMVRQTGKCEFGEDGYIRKGTIVRHLILPGHTGNSIKALRYLHETYGEDIYISIMNQYTPVRKFVEFKELNRKVTKREYEKVLDAAVDMGIQNGFIQEGETASESFIPDFDYEGVEKNTP